MTFPPEIPPGPDGQRDAPGTPIVPTAPGAPGRAVAPSILQRFFWLFSSPRKAFQPPLTVSVWLIPLIALSLVQISQTYLLRDLMQEHTKAAIEQNEKIPEDQKAQIIDRLSQPPSPAAEIAQALGGVIALCLLGFALTALLYMLGLNFVLGARARFAEIFAITALSGLVTLPRELLRLPLMLSKHSLYVYTSPAAFVSPDQGVLSAGLNMFDVFELYRLVLLAVGFSVLTALPVRRTAYPVVAVWLFYGLLYVGCKASPLGQWIP